MPTKQGNMKELAKFIKRLKDYISNDMEPCKPHFSNLIKQATTEESSVDMDKVYYLEHIFLMTMLGLKYFMES
jgi:hypothetical protein